MMTRKTFLTILAATLCVSCNEKASSDTGSTSITPVFVTVAGHIEDSLIYTDCVEYDGYRAKLLTFANAITAADVEFNLQVSYEWFVGVSTCETEEMKAQTNGKNIIDYLVENHNFEIDVHQEGASLEHATSGNNFADIRWARPFCTCGRMACGGPG